MKGDAYTLPYRHTRKYTAKQKKRIEDRKRDREKRQRDRETEDKVREEERQRHTKGNADTPQS